MKKIIITALLASLAITSAHAASGIFGAGIVLDNNGTTTLFELTLLGDSRHDPLGFSPILDATGWGAPENLGSFDSTTDTLSFLGGEVLTYKNGTDNVTGASIYVKIDDGAYTGYALAFDEDSVGGSSGDQRWYSQGFNVDLDDLGNGSHSVSAYFEAPFTYDTGSGTHAENNGGSNFNATFNVVPEPATLGLVALSGALLIFVRRFSRQSI